jgi:hypothetical protein
MNKKMRSSSAEKRLLFAEGLLRTVVRKQRREKGQRERKAEGLLEQLLPPEIDGCLPMSGFEHQAVLSNIRLTATTLSAPNLIVRGFQMFYTVRWSGTFSLTSSRTSRRNWPLDGPRLTRTWPPVLNIYVRCSVPRFEAEHFRSGQLVSQNVLYQTLKNNLQ